MSPRLKTLPTPYECAWKEYVKDPFGLIDRAGQKVGDIIALHCRDEDELFYILTNPDHIAQVLKERLLFVKEMDSPMLKRLFANGLFSSEGSYWQQQRRLIQPFYRSEYIKQHGIIATRYAQVMLKNWHEDQILDICVKMINLASNVMASHLFGQDSTNERMVQLMALLDYRQLEAGEAPEARIYKIVQQLDNIIYQEISDRRNGLDKNDLLGILMQIEDADDGSRMSDQQLRDEVVTLMVAGREAVANALSWTWLELARHPSAYGEFTQEIKTVLGGSMPTVDHLPRLTYTNKLITEILRLYPSTQDLVRRSTQDREVGDYWMPKGTLMFANAWIVHRHPQHFPDPEVFNPHRWDDDLERHLPPAVYSPFGYGPRTCIGKNFALLQIRLILATIAQQFRVELVPNQKIKLKFSSLTISPKNGVKVLLKRA